jgi:hypothetical protein
MPDNVKYNKLADAKAYASEVGGHVIGHDDDKDGHPDNWTVVVEGATSGAVGQEDNWTTAEEERETFGKYAKSAQQFKPAAIGERPEEERNMGGAFVDELGYRHGGMTNPKRDPIKYAAGGAVRGKRFVGNF